MTCIGDAVQGPAVQAALVPALRRCAEGPDGRYGRRFVRNLRPERQVLNGSESVMPIIARLPGTFAEQTSKHRARDALG
jgi:hypothetical protein